MIGGPDADDELLQNYDQAEPSSAMNKKKENLKKKIITVSSLLALHLMRV